MDATELDLHRKNTTAFIAVKPSVLTLTPHEQNRTQGGGYRLDAQPPRDPQTMRIIELGAHQSPPILVLTDGKQREASYWLLAEWDADMAVNDTWMAADGREWLVGDIVRSNEYETRGLVVERGK